MRSLLVALLAFVAACAGTPGTNGPAGDALADAGDAAGDVGLPDAGDAGLPDAGDAVTDAAPQDSVDPDAADALDTAAQPDTAPDAADTAPPPDTKPTDAGAPDAPDAAPPLPTELAGRLQVIQSISEGVPSGASVSAELWSGPVPSTQVVVDEVGDCKRLEGAITNPWACEPECEYGLELCIDGACEAYPDRAPTGPITLTGLSQTVTLTPNADGSYPSTWSVPDDLITPGAAVTATSPGDVAPALSLTAKGVEPLVASPDTWGFTPGEDYTVTWTPGDGSARIQLLVNTGWHGSPNLTTIWCETADDGELTAHPPARQVRHVGSHVLDGPDAVAPSGTCSSCLALQRRGGACPFTSVGGLGAPDFKTFCLTNTSLAPRGCYPELPRITVSDMLAQGARSGRSTAHRLSPLTPGSPLRTPLVTEKFFFYSHLKVQIFHHRATMVLGRGTVPATRSHHHRRRAMSGQDQRRLGARTLVGAALLCLSASSGCSSWEGGGAVDGATPHTGGGGGAHRSSGRRQQCSSP